MPEHPLAVAQQELDLAVAGSALGQPGQPRPGRGEPPRPELLARPGQILAESPGLHRADPQPGGQRQPDPDGHHHQSATHRLAQIRDEMPRSGGARDPARPCLSDLRMNRPLPRVE